MAVAVHAGPIRRSGRIRNWSTTSRPVAAAVIAAIAVGSKDSRDVGGAVRAVHERRARYEAMYIDARTATAAHVCDDDAGGASRSGLTQYAAAPSATT